MKSEQIEFVSIDELKPFPGNPRRHSRKQRRQIAASIERFGFTAPVLIDEDGVILAGHGRVEGAKIAGLTEVPCRRVVGLSSIEKRAYVLADNKLAENARWDESLLAIEVKAILADLDFDLELTGFDAAEIDLIIESEAPASDGDLRDDALPQLDARAVSRPGDLWVLGDHRLLCADALQAEAYDLLLGSDRAHMVFSDPPYNLRIKDVVGSGRVKHPEFAMASGEMTEAAFTAFLASAFRHCAGYSVDGAIHFFCMDWRHQREILDAGRACSLELKNVVVWDKGAAGMGSFYRSAYELVFAFKSGAAPHANNFGLGKNGRHRTNLWRYRGVAGGGAAAEEALALHPTVKPAAMIADAMRDCSTRGAIILDPFCGSGSTIIAAEKTGRRARTIEIDATYVDRSVRRWRAFAHEDAFLSATGETFADVERRRAQDPETH